MEDILNTLTPIKKKLYYYPYISNEGSHSGQGVIMFSFILKKAYNRVPLVVVPLIMAGLLFASCDNPADSGSGGTPIDAATPTISEQPQGGEFDVGDRGELSTFQISVTAGKSDSGALSYQWFTNTTGSSTVGTLMNGKTGATLTLSKAEYTQAEQNGNNYFFVIVTNTIANNGDGGKKTSAVVSDLATVLVNGAGGVYRVNAERPDIDAQPEGGEWDVNEDETFELTVGASVSDGGSLTYQWYSTDSSSNATGGSLLTGKTSATLTLNSTDYTANGPHYFYVLVTNTITNNEDGGIKSASTTSNVATVLVNGVGGTYIVNAEQPVIDTQPEGGTFDVSDEPTFELEVVARSTDGGTLTYQWYSTNSSTNTTGGSLLTGKTGATLTLNSADYTANGNRFFYVIVKNTITDNHDGGEKTASTTSNVATVFVNGAGGQHIVNAEQPVIGTQPTGGALDASDAEATIELTVAASVGDGGALSYQWYKNASNSNSGGSLLAGKTGATLTLRKADFSADGNHYFYVVVTNTIADNDDGGDKTATATSNVVTVTVSGLTTPLTINVWEEGNLPTMESTEMYSFVVTEGITYYVWWDDNYSGATPRIKTSDIIVRATYSDGTYVIGSANSTVDSGWIDPPFFKAAKNDTITVIVRPSSSKPGTFAITYSTASVRPGAAVPRTITEGQWADDTIGRDEVHVYTINATDETEYFVWWNETGNYGDGSKTANVEVRGIYADETVVFYSSTSTSYAVQWQDTAWASPRSFTVDRTGPVTIMVRPYHSGVSSAYTGTYGIAYSTSSTRPVQGSGTLQSVTANGSSGTPTTELTLTFDQVVSGLSARDITLSMSNHPFGVTKGALSNNGAIYTLEASTPIGGTLTVAVAGALLSIEGSPKTVTVFGGGGSIPTLVEDQWVYNSLTSGTDVHWYQINVTAGTTYGIWWDDERRGISTMDTRTAVYGNGTWLYGTETSWPDENGYTGPTASYSYTHPAGSDPGTIYVGIKPYAEGTTLGVYGVAYSTGSTRPVRPDIPVTLISVTQNGSSGTPTTALTLTFSQAIPGLSSGDVTLTMTSPYGFTKGIVTGNGPIYTLGLSAPADGTMTVSVAKEGYAITDSTKTVSIYGGDPITPTPLTANQWAHGNVPSGSSVQWYTFAVTAGTKYSIWWNDKGQGYEISPGTKDKTGDVQVSALYDDGTVIFTPEDHGWNNAKTFTPSANGTVYVKVHPYSFTIGFAGTYAIVFSTGDDAEKPVYTPLN
jgi:hypothetical protein